MIFTDWVSGSVAEYPGTARVEPAIWSYGADGIAWTTEAWGDPLEGSATDVPSAPSSADTEFEEEWPGVASRGWLPYWLQPELNLNALGLYVAGNGALGHATNRGMAQEVWFVQDVPAIHPAFAGAPEGFDLIQFADEDEPLPIGAAQTGRGRPLPTDYLEYRIRVEAAITNKVLEGGGTVEIPGVGTAEGVFGWGLQSTSYDRSGSAGSGGFVRSVLGASEKWGVIQVGDGTYLATGAPESWETEVETNSLEDSFVTSLYVTNDSENFPQQLLLRMFMSGLVPDPADPEDPEYGELFNRVEVVRMQFFTKVQWPAYRYARAQEGMWSHRNVQTAAGNSGGWPTRHVQSNGSTGAWPHRHVQHGN